MDNNLKLIALFTNLDNYSKSVLPDRIPAEARLAKFFLLSRIKIPTLENRQREQLISAGKKFQIPGY